MTLADHFPMALSGIGKNLMVLFLFSVERKLCNNLSLLLSLRYPNEVKPKDFLRKYDKGVLKTEGEALHCARRVELSLTGTEKYGKNSF